MVSYKYKYKKGVFFYDDNSYTYIIWGEMEMMITILAGLDKSYITLPSKNISQALTDIEPDSIIRAGEIVSDSSGYSVSFKFKELQVYNKTGFSDRQSAILYEQEILDKYLAEVI